MLPNGLGMAKGPNPNPLAQGYTLSNFKFELNRYFETVESIEYDITSDTSPRMLIVCTGKRKPA
jgi:hypothetical protein